VPAPWIIKSVDILEYRAFCLTACIPSVTPDQLSLDGFKERFDHRIITTISLAAHPLPGSGLFANHERGDLEAVLGQALLILI
jgi:hypothetical protein